jgi:quinol monooxygenase YgiN
MNRTVYFFVLRRHQLQERKDIMIIVTMEMTVLPEKQKELLQTLQAISASTHKFKGCISSHIFQDMENESTLSLIQKWETQGDLDNHLRSDEFSALLGTDNLLSKPFEFKLNGVSYTAGMEDVKAAHKQRT